MPEYTTGVQQVLPEGDYEFVVDDAGEKESSKGNPMIELQLLVEHDGAQVRVYDNLAFVESAFWKIDVFRFATGDELVEGQTVNFEAEDCIGRRGKCHLYVSLSTRFHCRDTRAYRRSDRSRAGQQPSRQSLCGGTTPTTRPSMIGVRISARRRCGTVFRR
jgi:hypothetical protein